MRFDPDRFGALLVLLSQKNQGISRVHGADVIGLSDSRDSGWAGMDHRAGDRATAFEAYVGALVGVIGHADPAARAAALERRIGDMRQLSDQLAAALEG